jgi:hypothetical protein
MGTGIVLAGQAALLAGLDISNFLDDPKLRLSPKDLRPRNPHERAFVHLVVMHSTLGIPGGTDLRRQTILPGFGPPTNAGERTVAMWASDPSRPAGAHLIVDFDGRIYCCADLVTEAAYHAQLANGCSIGIEIVQGLKSAEMYTEQLAVAADLATAICAAMPTPIQKQIPTPYLGHPIGRFVASQQTGVPLADVVGIVGHRDLTATRGEGDPGNTIMEALAAQGCERFDFENHADIAVWKSRQTILGMANPDGIPGPMTVAALKSSGRSDGFWKSTP